MSRGLPSMTALLGLLAIAGYQNRDKIAEMLGGRGQAGPGANTQGGLGGLLDQLGLGGASAGGVLSGGLGELWNASSRAGRAKPRNFWVNTGTNKPCTATTEKGDWAGGSGHFAKETGLSRTTFTRDFAANSLTRWTSIRRKAVCQWKPIFRTHSWPTSECWTSTNMRALVGNFTWAFSGRS